MTVHNHSNQPIKSDHFLISCEICQDTSCHSSTTSNYIYDYPKADYSGLCQYLFSSNIYSCLQFNDVEIVWNIIKEALFKAIELFVPKVKVRTKQYPKWFTPQLIHEANCLRTLRKKYTLSPTAHNLNRLTTAGNLFNDKVESAKVTYETNLIESLLSQSNPAVYRYLRSITNHKGLPTTVVFNNTHASSDIDKANLFNTYFSSVFSNDPSAPFELPDDTICSNHIGDIEIS